ncbi:MAG: site-specific DNA-methyltransferase [Caldilineaceae bacterium]|nr:site-specific DNA-methyltransferase [Caldilineaceae bacterium]
MASKHHVTLRTSKITDDQIDDLAIKWGENKSQVIIRSVDRIWVEEMKSDVLCEQSGLAEPESPDDESEVFFSNESSVLYLGDAGKVLATLESESIDCIVTSPPYYGQRDYTIDGQIGLEHHPELYISNLVAVFREAYRVLKSTGSLWVNIGDTYWSGKGKSHGIDEKQRHRRFSRPQDKTGVKPWGTPKQLLLIPHRFAIAMQDDGWCVRGDNVWYKPNPTPDPVEDRCARAHEYMFHFVKQRHYWFDAKAVAVPSNGSAEWQPPHSVWSIKTVPSQKNHKAAFPDELIALPLKATLPPSGTLLDPFCGSGTALGYAIQLGDQRQAIGIDLSRQSLLEAQAVLTELKANYSSISDE